MRFPFSLIIALLLSAAASVSALAADEKGPLTFKALTDEQVGTSAVAAVKEWANGKWVWSVSRWDYNGDDKDDLLLVDHRGAAPLVLRQVENNQFVPVPNSEVFPGLRPKIELPWQMRPLAVDIDGDGLEDLILSTEEQGGLPLLLNAPSGMKVGPKVENLRSRFGVLTKGTPTRFNQFLRGWGRSVVYDFEISPVSVKAVKTAVQVPADYPEALKAQLADLAKEDATVIVKDYPNRYCGPFFLSIDLDRDGIAEEVGFYFGSYGYAARYRFIWILRRDSNGQLVDCTTELGLPKIGALIPPFRDMTGDGLVDFIVGFTGDIKTSGLFVQQTDGTFKKSTDPGILALTQTKGDPSKGIQPRPQSFTFTTGSYLYGTRFIDFDLDGDDDLFATTYRLGGCQIFENLWGGRYRESISFSSADSEGFEVADLDRDGLLDAVRVTADGTLTIFRNVTEIKAPQPPPVDPNPTDPPAEEPTDPPPSTDPPPATDPPPSEGEGGEGEGDPKPGPEPEPEPQPAARKLMLVVDGQSQEIDLADVESIEIRVTRKPLVPIPEPGPLPPPVPVDPKPEPEPAPPEDPPVPLPVEPAPTDPPAPPPVPVPAAALRHPLESVDPASPAAKAFLAWTDQKLKSPTLNVYGFSRWHAALAYKLTGNDAYARLATDGIGDFVVKAKAAVAAGKAPEIARDRYLYVADDLRAIVYPLLWCGHLVDSQTRADLIDFGSQTIFNTWNPTKATYYGKSFASDAIWAQDDPSNNYYFAFVDATVSWALLTKDEYAVDVLTKAWGAKIGRLQRLQDQMAALPEGGSREGTGYGTAQSICFGFYSIWEKSTGERLADKTVHARRSMDYLVHASTPGKRFIAPIGDQARDATASFYDYHRTFLLRLIALYPESVEAKHARWLLQGYPKMRDGFNLVDELYASVDGPAEPPVELSYSAKGAGHYFARSSWGDDAAFVDFQAGIFWASHMAQAQGHFDFWGANGWLTSTNNVHSTSGINQGPEWQNVVRLVDASGATVQQDKKATAWPVATVTDDGSTWTATANLSKAYRLSGFVWNRSLNYARPNKLTIADACTIPAAYSAIWQISTAAEPVINGNVAIAGKLRATVLKPEGATLTARDWKVLTKEANSGWRLEVTGGSEFLVQLEVLP